MKRLWMMPLLLVAALTTTAYTGCTANPFKAAEGADEQAYAVLGSYAIYQRQALKIVQDATLPDGVRRAAAAADAAAYPILKSVDSALVDVLNAKAALDAGSGSKEKVAIATANLQKWTAEGKAAVAAIKAAVINAKKTLAYIPKFNPAWSV